MDLSDSKKKKKKGDLLYFTHFVYSSIVLNEFLDIFMLLIDDFTK